MANTKITDLQLRASVTAALNFPSDDTIQSYRVTAQQIKDYILSNGNIIAAMLANSSVITAAIATGAVTDVKTAFSPTTIQRFLSGTGTYTTPAGCKRIEVEMVGGGAGGGGSGYSISTPGGSGAAGVATTFGSSLLTANGAEAPNNSPNGRGGFGGTATISGVAYGRAYQGTQGGPTYTNANSSNTFVCGGAGGSSPFGGGGSGGAAGTSYAGVPNSGSGGGGAGAGSNAQCQTGFGGGAGGWILANISSPLATYSYAVGAGGAGGTAGTNGSAGGLGGSGVIIVTEFYQ